MANSKVISVLPDVNIPQRLRAKQVMVVLGVSRTKFYQGLKTGMFPAPSGNDGRPYWSSQAIRDVVFH